MFLRNKNVIGDRINKLWFRCHKLAVAGILGVLQQPLTACHMQCELFYNNNIQNRSKCQRW